MRKYLILAATVPAFAAFSAAGQNLSDHGTAPGGAFGSAPAHIDQASGSGPEIHRPAPIPGTGVVTGTTGFIGEGAGGPTVLHQGAGRGNYGSPAGGKITGTTGGGEVEVEHGHVATEGRQRPR